DDGRSFLRRTEKKYDLVVYAVVDSLVLHSGYSSVRLENFLFTREAFDDVRRVLKPGGVFVMYNFYRQGWVVARLAAMAEQAFGAAPLVIAAPYRERIRADDRADGLTFLMVSPDAARLAPVREAFARAGSLWMGADPAQNDAINAFRREPP